MTEDDLASLFGALGDTPHLPDAACRGRHQLFDSDEPEDITDAIRICHQCPELFACKAWADQLPFKALSGVVGGRYREWAPSRSLLRTARK